MHDRKIMTYPFTGLDYEQIIEIGNNVRVFYEKVEQDDQDVKYIISTKYISSYVEGRFGMRQDKASNINDERVKLILCYFKLLSDMTRSMTRKQKIDFDDKANVSCNTYIDVILICINEIISNSKRDGVFPDFNELFGRFGKRYKKDELPEDYIYIKELFNFLLNDSYLVSANSTDKGINFDMLKSGSISDIVNDVVLNKDDIDSVSKDIGPKLVKKIPTSKVI